MSQRGSIDFLASCPVPEIDFPLFQLFFPSVVFTANEGLYVGLPYVRISELFTVELVYSCLKRYVS